MKKAAVFLMILTLSVSSAACGNKEKDDNQADAKTEQSQNADNSKDNDKSDTQTKAADNKMYELSSEDDVWTIKVSAPKGCSETDFSSDTARAFERIGNVDGSSLQYVMTLIASFPAQVFPRYGKDRCRCGIFFPIIWTSCVVIVFG